MYGPPNVRGVNLAALGTNAPAATSFETGDKLFVVKAATSNVWRIKFEDIPDNNANIVQFYNTVTDASVAEFTFQDVLDGYGPFGSGADWAAGLSDYIYTLTTNYADGNVLNALSAAVADTSAVDITFNTGTSNIGVRIVKGGENDETQVWTAPWVKVSGAGTAAANVSDLAPVAPLVEATGTYWQSVSNPNIKITVNDWDTGAYSFLIVNDEAALYGHSGYFSSPPDVTTWALVDGTSPAPTVSLTGSDAVTQSITRDVLLGYKVYRALLTQSGTDAPVATVLENTLGGTVTFTRDSPGVYFISGTGLFPAERTLVTVGGVIGFVNSYTQGGGGEIDLTVLDTTGTNSDGILSGTALEILVYN